jgi:hypothetical protein
MERGNGDSVQAVPVGDTASGPDALDDVFWRRRRISQVRTDARRTTSHDRMNRPKMSLVPGCTNLNHFSSFLRRYYWNR